MSEQNTYRILTIGDADVGKTSILTRFLDGTFGEETEDFESRIKNVKCKDTPVKLIINDTAGQEKFRTLTSGTYRGVHGVLIVFSLEKKEAYGAVPQWKKEVEKYSQNPNAVIYIVANKTDLPEKKVKVSLDEARQFATENNVKLFEVSAKENQGIAEMFDSLVADIFEIENPPKEGCCIIS